MNTGLKHSRSTPPNTAAVQRFLLRDEHLPGGTPDCSYLALHHKPLRGAAKMVKWDSSMFLREPTTWTTPEADASSEAGVTFDPRCLS